MDDKIFVVEWVKHNLGTFLAIVIPTVMSLIKISPLNLDPWNSLFNWISKSMSKPTIKRIETMEENMDILFKHLDKRVNEVETKIDDHVTIDDERYVKQCRIRILHFDDEILRGEKHSKEHFQEIMRDITDYEAYCESNRGYKNSLADVAIGHIKQIYLTYPDERYFMKV